MEHGKITVQQKSFSEKSGYGTYKFTVVGEAVLVSDTLCVIYPATVNMYTVEHV